MTISAALMSARSGDRVHYLSLAIEARLAVKGLKEFSKTRRRNPELTQALHAAINSIRALTTPKKLFSELHGEGEYAQFEQIQTVEEVTVKLNDGRLLERLSTILAETQPTEEDIQWAIRFFSAVEKRALYHYSDPYLIEAS